MDKFEINGVTFTDFGANNYSNGMHLITASADIVTDVLAGKYPGIHLNPSAPCHGSEFYGVFGTEEQYREFYNRQREAQLSSQIIPKVNTDWSNYREVRAEVEANYKDWWEK